MNKPVVGYTEATVVGAICYLKPVDHPNHLEGHSVSNTRVVRTSPVVASDLATGRIETRNTIYMPYNGDATLNGEVIELYQGRQ
jgi:hypothetical protein